MSVVSNFSDPVEAISGDEPYGINIEYEPDFLQLEQEALGKPEVEYGSSLIQAVPANWQLVKSLSLSLMERSRDLRLAIYLARAQLNLEGVAGFADGLELIKELLDRHWHGVHPRLDPEDNNDPLQRINILSSLCEPVGVLRELREVPLVSVRSLGQFCLRDIEIARGESAAGSEEEKVAPAIIDAAFNEVGQEVLISTADGLAKALACSIQIEQILTEKVGVAQSIDLSPLSALLRRSLEYVRLHLVDHASVEALETQGAQLSPAAISTPLGQFEIASRDDVKKILDRVCLYYSTHEPSSPVPLLLGRARELVDKKFMDLVQDLATDGLAQLVLISGVKADE